MSTDITAFAKKRNLSGLLQKSLFSDIISVRQRKLVLTNNSRKEQPYMQRRLKWMKLDNAAKIYPAARRKHWTNVFRISFSFKDNIAPDILQSALNRAVRRFPSIAARLRTGLFWYYLEEIPCPPSVQPEENVPLNRMTFGQIRKCAFRILYYNNRMSLELFHSIADGSGAMIFAKSLAAEYVRQRYGANVPCENDILSMDDPPSPEETEDSFGRFISPISASRKEDNSYLLSGTPEPDGFQNLICGTLDEQEIYSLAKKYGATVTVFLAAVMMKSIYDIQNEKVKNPKKRKCVRILIPVNLRKIFPSKTMRNFASYITPGINPQLGEYSFEEMISVIKHTIGLELTDKHLSSKFTPNVRSEQSAFLRIMPLGIKNIAMKLVYNAVGEKKSCINVSNLGKIELPPEMNKYVERVDFILGVQASSPCNCGVCSFGGKLRINFIRNIIEPELERHFFTELRRLGLSVYIESNSRS